jgi:hypothetical protein
VRAARNQERLQPYLDAIHASRSNMAKEAVAQLGPFPGLRSPGAITYLKKYNERNAKLAEKDIARIREEYQKRSLEPLRAAATANIERVRGFMIQALAGSPRFKGYEHFIRKFLGCPLTIEPFFDDVGDNGSMNYTWNWARAGATVHDETASGRTVRLVHQRSAARRVPADGNDVLVNPLEQDGVLDCRLKMAPKTWFACADGAAECFQMIAHEFGHLLNTCFFEQYQAQARAHLAELEAANDDGSLDPDIKAVKFLGRQLNDFNKILRSSESCLGVLSAPKNPILSSCKPDRFVTKEHNARCGDTALKDYPTQWNEAQADFWAASGLARWLAADFKTPERRARAAYEMWAQFCADGSQTVAAVEKTNAGTEDIFRAAFGLTEAEFPGQFNEILAKKWPKDPEKPKSCDEIPPPRKARLPEPWKDAHQEWGWRANRNYLRNADLRAALGCPDYDPLIPFAASPARLSPKCD